MHEYNNNCECMHAHVYRVYMQLAICSGGGAVGVVIVLGLKYITEQFHQLALKFHTN